MLTILMERVSTQPAFTLLIRISERNRALILYLSTRHKYEQEYFPSQSAYQIVRIILFQTLSISIKKRSPVR